MKTLLVVPARYASTRYPGKPLVKLRGSTGKGHTLLERSWRTAKSVSDVDRVVVATDDERIRDHASSFGAEVIMTSPECRNGTERCAEVSAQLDGYDLIVNLQGDAPLTPPWFVEALISGISDAAVATPVLQCRGNMRQALLNDRRNGRVGGTTAVFNRRHEALYFSKEVIPFSAHEYGADDLTPVYHHVGVYAYKPSALEAYATFAESPLEKLEGLEQLRFMEHGMSVKCVEVDAKGREFWELNNPSDVAVIEQILSNQNME